MSSKTKTTLTLFDSKESREADHRTIVIFGGRRGGTTAVAGVVLRLGVPLGGEDLQVNLEDTAFRNELGLEAMRATVAARNTSHDVWGWKHPVPHPYLEKLVPDLRNPRFIVVTRDQTSHSAGMIERHEREPAEALAESLGNTQKNYGFVMDQKKPTLFVSYEKLIQTPEDTITEIAAFDGRQISARQARKIADFIVPGGYQPVGRSAAWLKNARARRAIWDSPSLWSVLRRCRRLFRLY